MKGKNVLEVSWAEEPDHVHIEMNWRHQQVKPTPRTLLSLSKGLLEIAQDMINQVTEATNILWMEAPE